MKGKTKFIKSGNALLGIVTELVSVILILALAWGLCWVMVEVLR